MHYVLHTVSCNSTVIEEYVMCFSYTTAIFPFIPIITFHLFKIKYTLNDAFNSCTVTVNCRKQPCNKLANLLLTCLSLKDNKSLVALTSDNWNV